MYDPTKEGQALLNEINITLKSNECKDITSIKDLKLLKNEYKINEEKYLHLNFLKKKISSYTYSLRVLLNKYKMQMSMNSMADKLRKSGVCYCTCLADINDVNDSNVVACDSGFCEIGWYHKEHVKLVDINGIVICSICNEKSNTNV